MRSIKKHFYTAFISLCVAPMSIFGAEEQEGQKLALQKLIRDQLSSTHPDEVSTYQEIKALLAIALQVRTAEQMITEQVR